MVFAFLRPDTARNVLLILLGVGYLSYHVLHWWRRRPKAAGKKVKGVGQGKSKREVEERNLTSGAAKPLTSGEDAASPLPGQTVDATSCRVRKDGEDSNLTRQAAASTEKTDVHCPPPPHLSSSPTQSTVESVTGEELFNQARALPHQLVPDFETDGKYLDLLSKSAAAGYAPALAKLGEYAMRRAAWVEAYYWMSMAKRQGMQGLANVMREIRKNWSLDGFPDEAENVNPLFTLEAGSIGRALLHVVSGHEAAKAREFLTANHPEFL